MNDGENLLLLLLADADAVQGLPGAAVRTDQRLVVFTGERRRLGVGLSAQRANPELQRRHKKGLDPSRP